MFVLFPRQSDAHLLGDLLWEMQLSYNSSCLIFLVKDIKCICCTLPHAQLVLFSQAQ